jgi:hypothetical protein
MRAAAAENKRIRDSQGELGHGGTGARRRRVTWPSTNFSNREEAVNSAAGAGEAEATSFTNEPGLGTQCSL